MKENQHLKKQIEEMKVKLQERERAHNQARDLVTKNCGLQSAIDRLKRDVKELKSKNEELTNERNNARL